jgi:2-desacetyl-2-hydroxyethyl bacteriochlorophyllide A dehydrogenase
MKYKRVWFPEKGKVEFNEGDFTAKIENPNDVIFKNHYSQVSAGTELACLAGLEDWFPLPNTPGYTAVGEIVEKGPAVKHNIGEVFLTFGPHGQYFKRDISDRWGGVCVPVPQGLKEDVASFAHLADIAITALRVSTIQLGDWVAVTGMGPIGILAAQLAQLQGANVIGIDINNIRLDLAKKSGVQFVANSASAKDEVMKMTGGKGVQSCIEASGMSQVAESSMKFIAQYGEMILLGSPRAPYQSDLTGFLRDIHLFYPSITVKGALEFILPTHSIEFVKHSKERDCAILMNLLKEEKLNIKPFYTQKVSPEKAPEIYSGLQTKKDEYMGVVFDWTSIK